MSGRFTEGTRHQLAHAGADGLMSAAQAGALQVSGSPASVILSAEDGPYLANNARFDGAAWQRLDVALGASLVFVAAGGVVHNYSAAAGANPITWTASTLATGADSGWLAVGNYGASWAAFAAPFTPQYRKLPSGLVVLRGLVAKGAALALPETMFTLPAGYRPGGLAGVVQIFETASFAGRAEIRLYDTGVVALQAGGSATWVSLAGITFLGEN
jgi:hypothetical protein